MLSTYRSRKSKHEDTQKFDQHETYKISVEVAAPAAAQQFHAETMHHGRHRPFVGGRQLAPVSRS